MPNPSPSFIQHCQNSPFCVSIPIYFSFSFPFFCTPAEKRITYLMANGTDTSDNIIRCKLNYFSNVLLKSTQYRSYHLLILSSFKGIKKYCYMCIDTRVLYIYVNNNETRSFKLFHSILKILLFIWLSRIFSTRLMKPTNKKKQTCDKKIKRLTSKVQVKKQESEKVQSGNE